MFQEQGENTKPILFFGGMVLCLIIGSLITGLWMQKKVNQAKNELADFKKVTEQKKASSIPEAPKIMVPNEVFNVSGKVSDTQDGALTVKSFFFGEEKTFKVKMADGTKVIKRELSQAPPAPKEGEVFSPFKETDANFSDIKKDDSVSIESSENVKGKTEITAKTIYIEVSNLPVPPPIPSSVQDPNQSIQTPPPIPVPSKVDNLPAPTDLPAPPAIPQAPK